MADNDDRDMTHDRLPAKRMAAVPGRLAPLAGELEPEVKQFVAKLREIFGMLQVSLGQYAALCYLDKGTVSRYLNGKRIPPRGFVDNLLTELAATRDTVPTEELRDLVYELHMRALQVRDRSGYRFQVITDELASATTELRQTQRYARSLEAEVDAKKRDMEGLSQQLLKIRHDLDQERDRSQDYRRRSEADRERDRERMRLLQTERDRLSEEVSDGQEQLRWAQTQRQAVEERCRKLEEALETVRNPWSPETGTSDVRDRYESALAERRLSQAAELLDSPAMEERLRGIAEMSRMARESAESHPQVMERLIGFLRRTCAPSEPGHTSESKARTFSDDVRAAAVAIGRRDSAHDDGPLDLRELDLAGISLPGANLSGVELCGTDLSGANLASAHLAGADLSGAYLSGANLIRADLTSADLSGAILVAARLLDATLVGAELSGADFADAFLSGADLRGAVHIDEADFTQAKIHGVRCDDDARLPVGWQAAPAAEYWNPREDY